MSMGKELNSTAAPLEEILDGLLQPEKIIEPKHFYDEKGSKLFGQICTLPEYYQTRTEASILQSRVKEIADKIGPGAHLIEYGSGSSFKTRILLRELTNLDAYVPIDICPEQLNEASGDLRKEFPGLSIEPVCADYTQSFALPASLRLRSSRRVFFFPGSTVGNLEPEVAVKLLKRTRKLAGPQGALIIGVDLKKDTQVLHNAYNDAAGVTANFNLNLLTRLNREYGADFKVHQFCHQAFYNERKGRIEMHLVSLRPQAVNIDGNSILFREGETIHTECSYKYAVDEFQALAQQAGYTKFEVWTDENPWFSVHYLQ